MWQEKIYRIFKPLDQFASGRRGGRMLEVGEKALNFNVQNDKGESVQLSDFKGKKVILWFYPKADTPGCTAEGCGFRDRLEKFTAKNAVILGVSFDTVAENAAFVKKFGFQFPLLCDTKREIGIAYGACQTPTDTNASRIGYVIDETGKVAQVFPKVDARSFPETVLAGL